MKRAIRTSGSFGIWNAATYHERRAWPASCLIAFALSLRRVRIQGRIWSSRGPATAVKDAIRPPAVAVVSASQHWNAPKSWPTRWTGRSGLRASITAWRSAVRLCSANASLFAGAVERPVPRVS